MAKISINIPDPLEKELRNYATEKDFTLTNACITLLERGLRGKSESSEELKALKKEYKELKAKYDIEREERLKVLDDYKNFNSKLLELMQADRVLQIQDKPLKKSLPERIKIFFLGEEEK